jgi:hypothetical protein
VEVERRCSRTFSAAWSETSFWRSDDEEEEEEQEVSSLCI